MALGSALGRLFAGLCCALGCSAIALAPSHAQRVKFGPPPAELVLDVIDELPEAQRAELLAAAKDVFPVFIFVPGVMGSQLTRTIATEPEPRVIWGTFSRRPPDLGYRDDDKVAVSLLARYGLPIGSVDVYESAINLIKNLNVSYGGDTDIFPYDWRQSNILTAQGLSRWLCSKRTELEFNDRPVVFLAHSMGGLVLKRWLKYEFENTRCESDSNPLSGWLRIKKIVFGGTPHYGAPKAMSAFADSFYLYFDPAGTYAKLFGYVDREFLARPINDYGATFPSAYQLLPITSAACFPRTDGMPVAIQESDKAAFTNLDIFDVATWARHNWPNKLHSSYDKPRFLTETVSAHLIAARDFLCDLVDFDVDKKFDVTRIYGDRHRTICKLIVGPTSRSRSSTVSSSICAERGDGTVPAWVAGEFGRADAKTRVLVSTDHGSLFAADEFKVFLEGYQKSLHREWQERLVGVVGKEGIADLYAKTKYVIPSAPDEASGGSTAGETARRTVEKLGVSPRAVYDIAKRTRRGVSRADGLRVYADLAQRDPKTDPWALNNAAHIYLGKKNFVAAKALAQLRL